MWHKKVKIGSYRIWILELRELGGWDIKVRIAGIEKYGLWRSELRQSWVCYMRFRTVRNSRTKRYALRNLQLIEWENLVHEFSNARNHRSEKIGILWLEFVELKAVEYDGYNCWLTSLSDKILSHNEAPRKVSKITIKYILKNGVSLNR